MIAIGADHGGYKLKEELKEHYGDLLKDFGVYNEIRGIEEPKVAIEVSKAVSKGECELRNFDLPFWSRNVCSS